MKPHLSHAWILTTTASVTILPRLSFVWLLWPTGTVTWRILVAAVFGLRLGRETLNQAFETQIYLQHDHGCSFCKFMNLNGVIKSIDEEFFASNGSPRLPPSPRCRKTGCCDGGTQLSNRGLVAVGSEMPRRRNQRTGLLPLQQLRKNELILQL